MGQVQPDGPIDDYFPDYQFGCGWSYSSMTVVHRKAVSAAFFVAPYTGLLLWSPIALETLVCLHGIHGIVI